MCRSSVIAAASASLLAAALGCASASRLPAGSPEAARAEAKASSARRWVEIRSSELGASVVAEPETSVPAAPESAPAPPDVLESLSAPGVVFMIDDAECPSHVRQELIAHVVRFKRDDEGQLWWLVYRRDGDELVEIQSAKVALTPIGAGRVAMTMAGSPKGKPALFKDQARVVIGVPDEYSIEIHDPVFGRLVYDAKVGLLR